jgi:hypothetical protein
LPEAGWIFSRWSCILALVLAAGNHEESVAFDLSIFLSYIFENAFLFSFVYRCTTRFTAFA